MKISQVSFSRSLKVEGVGDHTGLTAGKTPLCASIDLTGETVTVTAKDGSLTLIPWAKCLRALPEPAPAKK